MTIARADASGNVEAPLSVGLNGTADITPRSGGFELQLARLNGTLGTDKFQLPDFDLVSARQ